MNSCLKLIVRKLDTILISAGNSNLDEMYDSLGIVTTLMAQMKLSGLKVSDTELLSERMSNFNDSTMQKMKKLSGFVNEYGENIPMKAKNCYVLEAVKRIGKTRAEDIEEADERTITAVMGSANLIAGIVKMDTDMI